MRITLCLPVFVLAGVALPAPASAHLRSGRLAVDFKLASMTAASARVIGQSDAVATAGVTWRRLTSKHVFAWHESRLRPVPFVRGAETQPRRVATWTIPPRVDGRRATLTGGQWSSALGLLETPHPRPPDLRDFADSR
jgi:hypothetical protein